MNGSSHLFQMLKPTNSVRIDFSKGELNRLRWNFFHHTITKIFKLLRRTHPTESDPEIWKLLNEISARCKHCQMVEDVPLRCGVSFGSDSHRFNERIFRCLLHNPKKDQVHDLYITDEGINFSAGVKLNNMEAITVCNHYIRCCASIYVETWRFQLRELIHTTRFNGRYQGGKDGDQGTQRIVNIRTVSRTYSHNRTKNDDRQPNNRLRAGAFSGRKCH